MGLTLTEAASAPSYHLFGQNMKGQWTVNLVFEIKTQDLNFTPSEECQELKFIAPAEVNSVHAFRTVTELAAAF